MLFPTVLRRARVGDLIEEGVGFGGARVGMTDSELISVWGDTILNHNPEGKYSLRLFRLSSGELSRAHQVCDHAVRRAAR